MIGWHTLLACVAGRIDQELTMRNEYLVVENRILRAQIRGRLRLKDEEYVEHYHGERNHQGVGNALLFPDPPATVVVPTPAGRPIRCRERLGGLLKFYYG